MLKQVADKWSRSQSAKMAGAAMAAGAALLGGTGIAQAQSNDIKPFAFKVGAYVPASNEVRRAGAERMLTLEGDYRLQTLLDSNSATIFSIGYIQNNDFRMVPFTVSQVFRDRNSSRPYYYGAGLGLYQTTLRTPETSGGSKTLFGGFVVLGVDLSGPFFLEAKYHLISPYDKKGVSGLQATVGVRF